MAQLVKNLPAMQETLVQLGKIWRRDRLPTPVFLGFKRCVNFLTRSSCSEGSTALLQCGTGTLLPP